MYPLSIQHLKLIDAIVQQGSLTQAAEKLYLTQPALSHQLRELEEGLGMHVFKRMNKRMILTEAGRKILQHAGRILPEMQRLQNDLLELKNGKTGTIRISTECYTCYHWLPGVISQFKKEYEQVRIEIVAEATLRPIDYMMAGNLDLGIVTQATDSTFVYEPLFDDELLVVVSREHPLAGKTTIGLNDLLEENIIVYDTDERRNMLMREVFLRSGLRPKSIQQVQLTEAIIEMVGANLGITSLANWVVKPFMQTKNLVGIPFSPQARTRTWYAATFPESGQAIQTFIRYMKKSFQAEINNAEEQ